MSPDDRKMMSRNADQPKLNPVELQRSSRLTYGRRAVLDEPREHAEPNKVREPNRMAEGMSESIRTSFIERRERDKSRESTGRLGAKNDLHYPEVRGECIESAEQLRDLVSKEYATLMRRTDFPKMMEKGVKQIELTTRFSGCDRLPHGLVSETARELRIDPESVRVWTKGFDSSIFKFMRWATPRNEAEQIVQRIRDSNNGVHSMKDLDKRLDSYLFGTAERNAQFYDKEHFRAQRYFKFLEAYSEGGNTLDIAKEVGISDGQARGYLNGVKPRLVNIAVKIPSESPSSGHMWLPRVVGRGLLREDWIQVPEKVRDYHQVLDVLSKLRPLDSLQMSEWARKFGNDGSRAESLMHLMGAICSDASVPISSTSSMAFGIGLSKAYPWSHGFGDSCCYHLGLIGVSAYRTSDAQPNVALISTSHGLREIRGKGQYRWESESSPVLRWIRKSCLGYDDSPKTYQKISADWILSSPRHLRIAFLQGLSDGDGCASYKANYFSISTHTNHEFAKALLGSFGLDTYTSKTYVRTRDIESLRNAAAVPPFKYATTRQDDLVKAVKLADATRRHIESNPPSADEIRFMAALRDKGLAFSAIREQLYCKYGYTLDGRTIRRLTRPACYRADAGRQQHKNGSPY